MTTVPLKLEEIYNLAKKTLLYNGCDELNAEAVANTVTFAEREHELAARCTGW
mgnify:CR=1 FL=1